MPASSDAKKASESSAESMRERPTGLIVACVEDLREGELRLAETADEPLHIAASFKVCSAIH